MIMKNLFAGEQWRNRHREWTYEHGERGGEAEMCGESNEETYISMCKMHSQRELAVCLRKLKQGLCTNLEGGMGREMGGRFRREGTFVYLWLIHVEA